MRRQRAGRSCRTAPTFIASACWSRGRWAPCQVTRSSSGKPTPCWRTPQRAAAVMALSLAWGLSLRAAVMAAAISAFGFGSLYTLHDPFTSDPLMYALAPFVVFLLLHERVASRRGRWRRRRDGEGIRRGAAVHFFCRQLARRPPRPGASRPCRGEPGGDCVADPAAHAHPALQLWLRRQSVDAPLEWRLPPALAGPAESSSGDVGDHQRIRRTVDPRSGRAAASRRLSSAGSRCWRCRSPPCSPTCSSRTGRCGTFIFS